MAAAATKARKNPERPTDLACELAISWAARLKGRNANVRSGFIRSTNPKSAPPLALVLRGGRGGAVRLKLLLSLLWIAGRPRASTDYPARAWAELLDLPDPEGKGLRRVQDAFRWLEDHRFAKIKRAVGRPAHVEMLNDHGGGQPYDVPWKTDDRYVKLPPGLWGQFWIPILSPAALAIWLILRDAAEGRDTAKDGVWLSQRVKSDLYHVSPETWQKGCEELQFHGFIEVRKRVVTDGDGSRPTFGFRRYRHAYLLRLDRFDSPPDFA